jgi:hypothetical protein
VAAGKLGLALPQALVRSARGIISPYADRSRRQISSTYAFCACRRNSSTPDAAAAASRIAASCSTGSLWIERSA